MPISLQQMLLETTTTLAAQKADRRPKSPHEKALERAAKHEPPADMKPKSLHLMRYTMQCDCGRRTSETMVYLLITNGKDKDYKRLEKLDDYLVGLACGADLPTSHRQVHYCKSCLPFYLPTFDEDFSLDDAIRVSELAAQKGG